MPAQGLFWTQDEEPTVAEVREWLNNMPDAHILKIVPPSAIENMELEGVMVEKP